ncbi:MAG TPA: ester cyclase [Acidimicrobiales bacterium]|nr:ester cyclase [Acidimicrobiales bacterium]
MAVDIIRILDAVYEEALNKGNLDALDEVFGPDYVDHGPLGEVRGLDAFKEMLTLWRQAFPDGVSTYTDVVRDGDRAAWRSQMTGTQLGALPGIPATGRRVHLETIDMGTVRDGQAAEHWSVMDRLSMLEQLGLVPAPEGASA